jgi:hypothetical protein
MARVAPLSIPLAEHADAQADDASAEAAAPVADIVTAPDALREDERVERLLDRVDAPAPKPIVAPAALRTARVSFAEGRTAELTMRGEPEPVVADVAQEVDPALVARAAETGGSVLVEIVAGAVPLVVGVVQTQLPPEVTVRADTIALEAKRELLLRAGSAALRLREDGEIEVVGGRISAVSRGLFKIVGRVLRLN